MSFLQLLPPAEQGQRWSEIRPTIRSQKIFNWLMVVAGVFLSLHFISQFLWYFAGIDSSLFRLIAGALDLNNESTIATWYSSATLLICGIGFALVALAEYQSRTRLAHHWSALSLLAFLFSADEVAGLHEKLNGPVKMVVDMGSLVAIAWVLPGIAFVVLLLLSFRRFFGSLPPGTRFNLVFGSAIFFAGCLGVEMLGGEYSDTYGRENLGYKSLVGLEEFLEMAGVAVVLRGILTHMNEHVSWRIVHRQESADRVAAAVRGRSTQQPSAMTIKQRLTK